MALCLPQRAVNQSNRSLVLSDLVSGNDGILFRSDTGTMAHFHRHQRLDRDRPDPELRLSGQPRQTELADVQTVSDTFLRIQLLVTCKGPWIHSDIFTEAGRNRIGGSPLRGISFVCDFNQAFRQVR